MAEAGRLRLRDDRLVVEGMTGEIIAEVEPDDAMIIDDTPIRMAAFLDGGGLTWEGRISVSWFQTGKIDPGYVDGDAEEIDPPTPELEAGDG